MKKNLSQRFIALILAVVCFAAYSFETAALTFNGTASSGGSGNSASSGSGSYGLPAFVNDDYNKAPAYRFTVIDAAGGAKTTPVDIYKKAYSKYAGTSYHKLENKYPKTVLKNLYLTGAELKTGATSANCVLDSDYGLSLPADTTGIMGFANADNLTTILQNAWGKDLNYLKTNSLCILIEPIYPVTLKGQNHSLTVTEMAVYGAREFGAATIPPSSGDQNSWAWISNYTNKLYPNALRLTSSRATLNAPAELTSRASFANIIEQGYGAALVYDEYLAPTVDPPVINKWTYKQNGSSGFTVYVDVDNADTLKIPVWTDVSGQDDLVWYDAKFVGTAINGETYNWALYISFADHNGEMGKYNTHFYAYNAGGSDIDAGSFTPVTDAPRLVAYRARQTGNGYTGFDVYLKVENADRVYQETFLSTNSNEPTPDSGINKTTPTPGSYVLDDVEYNYKFSVSFNEFVGNTIGAYTSDITLVNSLTTRGQFISYKFGYNDGGYAVEAEDGKGFYVYANSINTTSLDFVVERKNNFYYSKTYPAEEGLFDGYRFRAFVPYSDFIYGQEFGGVIDSDTEFIIKICGGNDYTFGIKNDNTTYSATSIHNPPVDEYGYVSEYPPDAFSFKPTVYTITYSDGYIITDGSSVSNVEGLPAAQTKIKYCDLVLDSTIPTHPDYVFVGWNDGSGNTYNPGETFSSDADTVLDAMWAKKEEIVFDETAKITIRVGDVFDPGDYLDVFNSLKDCEINSSSVVYNDVPVDAENKVTTIGNNYSTIYLINANGSIGKYKLIVTVLDENAELPGEIGRIRFISSRYLHTLDSNSKWRKETLNNILTNALSKDLKDTSSCQQVWYFPAEADADKGYKSSKEVQEWCLSKNKGTQTNKDFLTEFSNNQTK